MGVFDAIGAGVGAVTDIVTGQLDAAQNRQAQRMSADLQREFAQHGIEWRVEDAKRAGLHPLAALGMAPASGFTIPIGSNAFEGAGQNISRAISAAGTHDDRELERAQLELLKAQTNKTSTEAMLASAQLGKMGQEANQSVPPLGPQREYPQLPEGQLPHPPYDYTQGYIDVKAPPIMSSKEGDPSTQAGTIPGHGVLSLHPRMNMLVPAGEGQEATWEMWAELPWYEKIAFLIENANRFGPGWLKDYARVRAGIEPEGTHINPDPRPNAYTSTLSQPSWYDYATNEGSSQLNRYKKWLRQGSQQYRKSHGGR